MTDIGPAADRPCDIDDDDPLPAVSPGGLNGKHHPVADDLAAAAQVQGAAGAAEADIASVLRQNMTELLREVCRQMNRAADPGLSIEFKLARDAGDRMAIQSIRIAREY